MNKHSPIVADEPAWPALPEVPDGMAVKVRQGEALTAVVADDDRLADAEIAFDQAGRAVSEHELQHGSMPPGKWKEKARELRAARVGAEQLLSLEQMGREEGWQDFVAADIALEQQALHKVYRRYHEEIVDLGKMAEAIKAKAATCNAALPGNDRTLRGTHQNQMFRLFHTLLFLATGHSFSSVREIDAREFAVSLVSVPSDKAFSTVAEHVAKALEQHWLNCRETDPERYRSERARRKLGGKGGIRKANLPSGGNSEAIEEASP